MWESGLLAIGSSHFRRNLGVLLKSLSNLCVSLEGSCGGRVVLFGRAGG